MSLFLKQLRDDLEAIKVGDMKSPDALVGKHDRVIGELKSPELQRLFTLRCNLIDQAELMQQEILHGVVDMLHEAATGTGAHGKKGKEHDPLSCPQCSKSIKFSRMRERLEAINSLFWAGVKAELSDAQHLEEIDPKKSGGIGLCAGWKIVFLPPTPQPRVEIVSMGQIPPGLEEFLRHGR